MVGYLNCILSTLLTSGPGLYGFDVWGPAGFPRHYWLEVLDILRKQIGAEVIVTSVPGTGSIEERGRILDSLLKEKAQSRTINFMAHSMGGLDCRQVLTHIRPTAYKPLSLTTVATPHRGSPFMDWCNVRRFSVGRSIGLTGTRHR